MPAWLTWTLIKRLLPYIAVVLAIIGLLWWVYGKGAASRQPEIDAAKSDLKTATASLQNLTRATNAQSAAVRALAKAGAAAKADAAKAVQAGQKRAREVAGMKARLDALARQNGACAAPVPDAVRDAWESMK
jgi:hypothetical protein